MIGISKLESAPATGANGTFPPSSKVPFQPLLLNSKVALLFCLIGAPSTVGCSPPVSQSVQILSGAGFVNEPPRPTGSICAMCVAWSDSSRHELLHRLELFRRVSRNLGSESRNGLAALPLCRGLPAPPPPMSSINACYPPSDGRNVEEGKRASRERRDERCDVAVHRSRQYLNDSHPPSTSPIPPFSINVNPSRSCRRSPTVPACVVCCGDRILARAISILFVRWINRVSLPLSPSFSIRVIRSFGICVRKRPEFLNQIPRLEERIEKEDQEEKHHCFGQ